MKIVLFSRPQVSHTPDELKGLFGAVVRSGLDYTVGPEFADEALRVGGILVPSEKIYHTPEEACGGAEVAVSYGGDGTFLDCVRIFGRFGIPVLGINSGRLGFLANLPQEDMEQAFADLMYGRYRKEERSLILAEGDFPAQPEYPYAFNEFSIQRSGTSMISVETYIDGEMVATYWGDGVLFSTPAGSTAYSLSVGGPVVAPGCACFIISPIAPHNLTMRPVVVPDTATVTFRVSTRDSHAFATLDNSNFEIADGASFRVSKAEKPVFLIGLQNISFYDTLRNKMLWGIDKRDGTDTGRGDA